MAREKAPTIGLIGGIGSGKTAVAESWRAAGCCVCESDQLARAALREPMVRDQLVAWWGTGVLDPAGEIDRPAVARIVFADPAERRRLECLTHPWIERSRRAAFAAAPDTAPAFVIDAPLLLEVGLDKECDAVVFVDAPQAAREERVRARRGWTPEELARREAAQWPLDRKRSLATHVLVNDSDVETLRQRSEETLKSIVAAR